MKIIESQQFKEELAVMSLYIKKDKLSVSIAFVKNLKKVLKIYLFDNDEIRDMVHKRYSIVYEVNIEQDTLELLSIFNQNIPDL